MPVIEIINVLKIGKEKLAEELINEGHLKTTSIIAAFRKIDRADFVPENLQNEAYGNYPLPIGFGQTISQPLTVAFMLELLQPRVGEKILDIGSGSGWQTALLAFIVGRKGGGKVIAVERIKELFEMTVANVSKYNFIEKGIVRTVLGDGSDGFPEEAPFDKIIAAAAGESLPYAWKKQLKTGGLIVAPIENSIFVFEKVSENNFKEEEYQGFSFVPLVKN